MFNKKLALVLGAGGARGFCHIGVLKVLEEYNIKPDIIVGSSMGALVGGFYAAGFSIDEMIKISNKVNQATVMDFDLLPGKKLGLINGNKIKSILIKHLGDQKIEDLKIKFASIATDLISGESVMITRGELWKAMRASMSIPLVFKPFEYEGRLFVDGSVHYRLPIPQAYKLGADITIAVDAIGPYKKGQKPSGIIKMAEQTFLLMDWENTKRISHLCDLLLTPDMQDRNLFIFKQNDLAIKAGEECARQNIGQILKLLKKRRKKQKRAKKA
ncbi:MAG: patatin family protein [Clostridiales bacterium]|nr:patatin family protein [Clostridiales bacterium]